MKWLLLIILLPIFVHAELSDLTVEITDIDIFQEEIFDDGMNKTQFIFQNNLTIHNPTKENITVNFPTYYPFAVNITTDVEGYVGCSCSVLDAIYSFKSSPGDTFWVTNTTFTIDGVIKNLPDGNYIMEIIGPPNDDYYHGAEITYINAIIFVNSGVVSIKLANTTHTQNTSSYFPIFLLFLFVPRKLLVHYKNASNK